MSSFVQDVNEHCCEVIRILHSFDTLRTIFASTILSCLSRRPCTPMCHFFLVFFLAAAFDLRSFEDLEGSRA